MEIFDQVSEWRYSVAVLRIDINIWVLKKLHDTLDAGTLRRIRKRCPTVYIFGVCIDAWKS